MSLVKRRGTGAPPIGAAGTMGGMGGGGMPGGSGIIQSPLLHKNFSVKNILDGFDASHQTSEVAAIKKEVDQSIRELVKETKFAFMEKGEFFYLNKHLNHFRLPKMRRHIEFCEAKSASDMLTEVKKRIPIEHIQAVMWAGGGGGDNNSPQVKKKNRTSTKPQPGAVDVTFIFTIVVKSETGQEERYELQTSNRRSFVDWYDGLKLITGNEPELPETQEELDTLRSIELECRLIEEESKGAQTLMVDAPAIPPPPSDFNFYYK